MCYWSDAHHHIPVERKRNIGIDAEYRDKKVILTRHIIDKKVPVGELYSSIQSNKLNNDFLQNFLSREFETLVSELAFHNVVASK